MGRVQSQPYKKFLSPCLASEIAWHKAIAQNELQKTKRQKYARCPAEEEGLQQCPKSMSDAKGNCSSTGILGEAVRAQEQGKLVESSLGPQYESESIAVSHLQIFMWLLGSGSLATKGFHC